MCAPFRHGDVATGWGRGGGGTVESRKYLTRDVMSEETIIARVARRPLDRSFARARERERAKAEVVNIHKVTSARRRAESMAHNRHQPSIVSSSLPFLSAEVSRFRRETRRDPAADGVARSSPTDIADFRRERRKQFIRRAGAFYCIFGASRPPRSAEDAAADNCARCSLRESGPIGPTR